MTVKLAEKESLAEILVGWALRRLFNISELETNTYDHWFKRKFFGTIFAHIQEFGHKGTKTRRKFKIKKNRFPLRWE